MTDLAPTAAAATPTPEVPMIEADLMAGTLAWSLFQETVTRCLAVFIDNGNLLKKLSFPRICLPLVVAGIVTLQLAR